MFDEFYVAVRPYIELNTDFKFLFSFFFGVLILMESWDKKFNRWFLGWIPIMNFLNQKLGTQQFNGIELFLLLLSVLFGYSFLFIVMFSALDTIRIAKLDAKHKNLLGRCVIYVRSIKINRILWSIRNEKKKKRFWNKKTKLKWV